MSRIEYGKSPGTRWDLTLYWCAGVALLGVVLFGMTGPLLIIGRYIPLDPNEGWNAYFADAASNGGVLYPPADALITNNYPPLSFYIFGAVGHLTGDTIFAGRVTRYFAPLVALWLAALLKQRLGERMAFVSLYLIISTGVAVFAAGGAGVDVNSFFDTLIALCLTVGLALERLSAGARPLGAPAAVALAICLVNYGVIVPPLQLRDLRSIDADEQTALQDIQVIKEYGHGRAACEMLNLCYWAKSAFMVDFFYFGQKLKTGALPGTACADTFKHGDIAMVQLEHNPRWRAKLLPNDCDALITTQYQPIRESNFGPLLTRAAHP